MAGKKPQTNADLIRAIADAFDAVPSEDLDEARQELRSVGLDPDETGRCLGQFVRESLETSRLNWRVRAERERTDALAKLRSVPPILKPRQELELEIREILAHGSADTRTAARAFFHKHQGRASDADLASLLAQLQFLKTIVREKK
jgi:hypothetical protein